MPTEKPTDDIQLEELLTLFKDKVQKTSTEHRELVRKIRDMVAPNRGVILAHGDTDK
jgi:hypothetical protein